MKKLLLIFIISISSLVADEFKLIKYAGGDKYMGQVKNDIREGVGAYIYASGARYIGLWNNGARSGDGVYMTKDGAKAEIYYGNFKDSKYEGFGIYSFPTGQTYIGQLQGDYFEGAGVMIYPDGSVKKGKFSKDKFVSGSSSNSSSSYTANTTNSSSVMDFTDFQLDFNTLIGKSVSVKGYLIAMGDMGYIYQKRGSMNGISVEFKNLSRSDRKHILKNCSSGGCNMTITGIAEENYGVKKLVAKSIK